MLEAAAEGRKRYIAWHEPEGERSRQDARRADRGRRHVRPQAAARAGQGADPHVGHDRHAEGREPQAAAVARPGRGAARADPAQVARAHDDRRADVPLLGLRALHARDGAVRDDRAQAQVRPRGDALADRAARVHRADRRAGDDPADPRARRRGAAPLRPVEAQGGAGLRLGAAGRRLRALDGPVRRQPLQPLRLDRGRVGDDRDAGGPARRAGHRGQAAARDDREAVRRRRQRGRARARRGASSSATTSRSRATPAAATRTRSTGCSRPATSATSTTAGACSSTAATTT